MDHLKLFLGHYKNLRDKKIPLLKKQIKALQENLMNTKAEFLTSSVGNAEKISESKNEENELNNNLIIKKDAFNQPNLDKYSFLFSKKLFCEIFKKDLDKGYFEIVNRGFGDMDPKFSYYSSQRCPIYQVAKNLGNEIVSEFIGKLDISGGSEETGNLIYAHKKLNLAQK